MSFSIISKLSFIDSLQSPCSSIDSLVKNLVKDDCKCYSQEFDKNVLDLVNQKRVFLYQYMTDFEKFRQQLASKEKFYSSSTGKRLVTKNTNMFWNMVWNPFKMKMMTNYHDLRLKCAVLLLAGMFEKFVNNSIKKWITSKSLFAHTSLNLRCNVCMTKLKLELIWDPDMYIFFQPGMRRGVSDIFNRYTKANNKYLKSYNLK